jgi:8-oxo-dGTP diphosphatase
LEHEAAMRVTKDEIDDVSWLPADEELIIEIKKFL